MGILSFSLVLFFVLKVCFAEVLNDPKFLWGTYRPDLISAITQNSQTPITVGLAYSSSFISKPSIEAFKSSFKLRKDKSSKAYYSYHNGYNFARQQIQDKSLEVNYYTDFIKDASQHQSWSYIINSDKASPTGWNPKKQQPSSTYLYVAFENLVDRNQESRLVQLLKHTIQEEQQSILLQIWDSKSEKSQGYLRITVFDETHNKGGKFFTQSLQEVFYCMVNDDGTAVEDAIYAQLKTDILRGFIHFDPKSCGNVNKNANFFALQVVADRSVNIIVSYNSDKIPDAPPSQAAISEALSSQEQKFHEIIDSKFTIKNLNKYRFDIEELKAIQRLTISNILGNIKSSFTKEALVSTTSPSKEINQLFSQLLICKWDSSLCSWQGQHMSKLFEQLKISPNEEITIFVKNILNTHIDFNEKIIENNFTPYGVWFPLGTNQAPDSIWTEPISIPLNYLLLASLKKNSQDVNSQNLYKAIRENLIKLISSNWRIENTLWNSYDSFTGIGRGLPSFSSETSLILFIFSENYE